MKRKLALATLAALSAATLGSTCAAKSAENDALSISGATISMSQAVTAAEQHVGDAFYRMPATTGEGSGLGLAIAREAANRLGGIVSLHDRDGAPGLTFRYRQRRDA